MTADSIIRAEYSLTNAEEANSAIISEINKYKD